MQTQEKAERVMPTGLYTYHKTPEGFAVYCQKKNLSGTFAGEGYYWINLESRFISLVGDRIPS